MMRSKSWAFRPCWRDWGWEDDKNGCKAQISIEKSKGLLLNVFESKSILYKAGFPVNETRLARCKSEAIAISKAMGFPVVLKIASSDIDHKNDGGGVKVDLGNASRVAQAYSEIMDNVNLMAPEACIEGVTVQKMAHPGIEIIIGMSKDLQFGPVIMFGMGGVMVEILKDISFRIIPIVLQDAREMINEIKGFPVLKGYRNQEPSDIPALENLIVKVSDFIKQNPRIKELDLNPVFAYGDGVLAVDARIILE